MIAARIDADMVIGLAIVAITLWAIVAYLIWVARLAKRGGRSPWLACLLAIVCPPAIWLVIKPSAKDLSLWWGKSLDRNSDDPPESK